MSPIIVYHFICLVSAVYCIFYDIRVFFSIENIKEKILWLLLIYCLAAVGIHLSFAVMTSPYIWEVMKNEGAHREGMGSTVFSIENTFIFFARLGILPLIMSITNNDKKMSLERTRNLFFQFILSIVIIA